MEKYIMLSIVVPVYNEERSIKILYNKIKDSLRGLGMKAEVIFIDDGSSDGSAEMLSQLRQSDDSVKVFGFTKNRGQHKALEEGFRRARGKIIITMDADLQNDPRDIPRLISKLREGFDVVCTWRFYRKDPGTKLLKSKIGNYIQEKITKINLHDMGCTLRAYKREAIKGVVLRNRYEVGLLPYLLAKQASKITEIKIRHHRRIFGKSKYRLLSHTFGVVFAYFGMLLRPRSR